MADQRKKPTTDQRRKPGPDPELFKVPLPFEEAVKAALETNPPPPEITPKRRKKKR